MDVILVEYLQECGCVGLTGYFLEANSNPEAPVQKNETEHILCLITE